MPHVVRWTEAELKFDAKMRDHIEQQRALLEAKKGRPLTGQEQTWFWQWEAMTEETEWERFYGIAR